MTETPCLLIPDLPEGVSGAATRGVLKARVRVHCDGVHPGGRSHSPDGVLMGRMPELMGGSRTVSGTPVRPRLR